MALLKKDKGNVLDIGCNDGTMLGYYPSQFNKFGCDPSDVAQEVKNATAQRPRRLNAARRECARELT